MFLFLYKFLLETECVREEGKDEEGRGGERQRRGEAKKI